MKIKHLFLSRFFLSSIAAILLSVMALPAFAQFEGFLDNYEDKYLSSENGSGAENPNKDDSKMAQYLYEEGSVKALSHLYWAVNLYTLDDDKAIDEFLRINECELYKSFAPDEFEWNNIRKATRAYIEQNKDDFPTRFEFVIPLKLGDYDEKRGAFEIQADYKIESLRRFELYANDYKQKPCTQDHYVAAGYPRVVVLEFSRPFTLSDVPMSAQVAGDYIREHNKLLKSTFDSQMQTKKAMYGLRNAYLVLKAKIFAHGKFLGLSRFQMPMVQMLGVLEGFEVYEDLEKTKLFYSQSYINGYTSKSVSSTMREQFSLLKKKSEETGVLN